MALAYVSASSQYLRFLAGQFNGFVYDYGTVVALVRRSAAAANFYSMVMLASNAATYGMDLEFNTGGNLYFSLTGGTNASITNLNAFTSTTTWYLIGVTKATGTVQPRFHVFNYSTGAWTHLNGDTALANGTLTSTYTYVGSYAAIGDYFDGDIAATGIFSRWVPGDTEFEAMGLHYNRLGWYNASGTALLLGGKSWFSLFFEAAAPATQSPFDHVIGDPYNAISASPPTVSTTMVPNFGWGGQVTLASASGGFKPNQSRYLYRPALQRAANW
jgi:hypothetical protein